MKTTIHLKWNSTGNIHHSFSGAVLPHPRNNQEIWVLAPSAPLLLAHVFGSMRPTNGLITSSRVINMLFRNNYFLMPINSALRGARIEFIYTDGPAVKVKFHPEHKLFANSDSVEEGVGQLINNYTHYVYSRLPEYNKIVIRTLTVAAVGMYLDFLGEQVGAGRIGRGRDKWMPALSLMSAQLREVLSVKYYVPDVGRTAENEEWARKQMNFLDEQVKEIDSKISSLFISMGLH